jgi:drug/metabolite transporter (DMT)-like permease
MSGFASADFRLALGAVCIGFAPLFVRFLPVPPTVVGFYRCALAALILLPLVLIKDRHSLLSAFRPRDSSNRSAWFFFIAAGFVFSGDLAVWHRSIQLVGAGIATLLANTQVFYLVLFAAVTGREPLTARKSVAVLLGFAGLALISKVGTGAELPDDWIEGLIWGLSTGVFYASYLTLMKRVDAAKISLSIEAKIALVSTFTALGLFFIGQTTQESFALDLKSFLWLVSLAVICQIFGWILITSNLSRVPLSRAGIIIMLQPVTSVILSRILFNEPLSPLQILGIVATLCGVYLGKT